VSESGGNARLRCSQSGHCDCGSVDPLIDGPLDLDLLNPCTAVLIGLMDSVD
jgi:hypothetical protein